MNRPERAGKALRIRQGRLPARGGLAIAAAFLLSGVTLAGCRHLKQAVGHGTSREVVEYEIQLDLATRQRLPTADAVTMVEDAIRSSGLVPAERYAKDDSPYILIVGTGLNADQHRLRVRWVDSSGLCGRNRDATVESRGSLSATVRELLRCVQAGRAPGDI